MVISLERTNGDTSDIKPDHLPSSKNPLPSWPEVSYWCFLFPRTLGNFWQQSPNCTTLVIIHSLALSMSLV